MGRLSTTYWPLILTSSMGHPRRLKTMISNLYKIYKSPFFGTPAFPVAGSTRWSQLSGRNLTRCNHVDLVIPSVHRNDFYAFYVYINESNQQGYSSLSGKNASYHDFFSKFKLHTLNVEQQHPMAICIWWLECIPPEEWSTCYWNRTLPPLPGNWNGLEVVLLLDTHYPPYILRM